MGTRVLWDFGDGGGGFFRGGLGDPSAQGLGFIGFRVLGSGFRVWGLGSWVQPPLRRSSFRER